MVDAFSDFIEKRVHQEYIKCARDDNQELHNLAVIYFKIGDIENAISIAKFLTEKNAHLVDYNYLLLDFYRPDWKYTTDFEGLKAAVLQTFNLSEEDRICFEAILMMDVMY